MPIVVLMQNTIAKVTKKSKTEKERRKKLPKSSQELLNSVTTLLRDHVVTLLNWRCHVASLPRCHADLLALPRCHVIS